MLKYAAERKKTADPPVALSPHSRVKLEQGEA